MIGPGISTCPTLNTPIRASKLNFNHDCGTDPPSQGRIERRRMPIWAPPPPQQQASNQGAVVDSVVETFQGSRVQLAAPQDSLFMHWTSRGRACNGRDEFGPACERIRVTGVVTVVCQVRPAAHRLNSVKIPNTMTTTTGQSRAVSTPSQLQLSREQQPQD